MHTTVIRANAPWWRLNLPEVWEYRDLLRMLTLRDLTSIYKQTVLGPVWFFIQPLFTSVVFAVVFGKVAGIATDGTPKLVFYMCGTVLWNYCAGCLTQSGTTLAANLNLLTKVYFPRLVMPLTAVLANLAHALLNLAMFLGFYLYFLLFRETPMAPRAALWAFPLLLLQCAALGLAVGLWVSSMTVKYRDLRFALPFLTQLWMYATPIVWPASLVKQPLLKSCLWLNPMAFVVECARWMFTGAGEVTWRAGAISVSVTLLLLVSGLFVFNRVQRTFVDTI
ncbi:MAG: ABC transporter permease [Kiritimatiellae bacterium]|nr:ABC transporter permease [Kiritimatiellia bacterium]